MQTHDQAVHEQFDPQARAYLASAVHAQGPDLERARELVAQSVGPAGQGLDVGCGAGHLAFALAPALARITALDPSEGMLATVRDAARARGLANVEVRQGSADRLPFEARSFDLVATRYSAHHWVPLGEAMTEMRRVLRPGGHVLVIDVEAPANPLVDTHLQAIELLRDRSHVRDRSEAEWRGELARAGFELLEHRRFAVRLEFSSWVERMRTPADKVAMLRALQSEAPREVRESLAIEPDGSFTIQTALYWGRAAP